MQGKKQNSAGIRQFGSFLLLRIEVGPFQSSTNSLLPLAFNSIVGNVMGRNDLGNGFTVPAAANLRRGLLGL